MMQQRGEGRRTLEGGLKGKSLGMMGMSSDGGGWWAILNDCAAQRDNVFRDEPCEGRAGCVKTQPFF